jgi:hypothetical protein
MRYMLLIYGDETQQAEPSSGPSGAAEISPPWIEYSNWLDTRGINVGGERLASSASATTVRTRDGNRLITDGPFAETKEVLGGYYIIECADLDEALDAAARCPGAAYGSVEVRPLLQITGMTGPAAAVASTRPAGSAAG